jgi:hypothetical protein
MQAPAAGKAGPELGESHLQITSIKDSDQDYALHVDAFVSEVDKRNEAWRVIESR